MVHFSNETGIPLQQIVTYKSYRAENQRFLPTEAYQSPLKSFRSLLKFRPVSDPTVVLNVSSPLSGEESKTLPVNEAVQKYFKNLKAFLKDARELSGEYRSSSDTWKIFSQVEPDLDMMLAKTSNYKPIFLIVLLTPICLAIHFKSFFLGVCSLVMNILVVAVSH